MNTAPLGWLGILRLGLVQTSLGGIVVITTSTLNRVMVVELLLPAMVPGALVALHYAVQVFRPRFGFGSDIRRRRTPWIVGGMAVLAGGAVLASLATALAAAHLAAGMALAVVAFVLIGVGVGAAGTALLALMAERVAPQRRAAAAAIAWLMMIGGFVVTAGLAGRFLDPFSLTRLVLVTGGVAAIAFLITLAAIARLEGDRALAPAGAEAEPATPIRFRAALAEVWRDDAARRFTVFVFASMIAYSAQDLILEPFAGLVFGLTPGETTRLSGLQNAGVFVGMVLVGFLGGGFGERPNASLGRWIIFGCLVSAAALAGLAAAGRVGPGWPLLPNVFVLGFGNGMFAVAAIGAMMQLAGGGHRDRRGTRIGLWGAAQGIGFGIGGFSGTIAADAGRAFFGAAGPAYGLVFAVEAVLFLAAAVLAARAIPAAARSPLDGLSNPAPTMS